MLCLEKCLKRSREGASRVRKVVAPSQFQTACSHLGSSRKNSKPLRARKRRVKTWTDGDASEIREETNGQTGCVKHDLIDGRAEQEGQTNQTDDELVSVQNSATLCLYSPETCFSVGQIESGLIIWINCRLIAWAADSLNAFSLCVPLTQMLLSLARWFLKRCEQLPTPSKCQQGLTLVGSVYWGW